MKIHPWTARFTDQATEAAFVANQSGRDQWRQRYGIWGLIGLATIPPALLLARDPGYDPLGPLFIFGGILLIYLYLPGNLPRRAGLALVTSLVLGASWSFWNPPPPLPELILATAWLLLINAIGYATARAQQIEQRQSFLHTLDLESTVGREAAARRQRLRFSSLVAHEFRNPLAIIKCQAQVTEREASTHPGDANATRVLHRQRIIERAVTRLEWLFQQWLDNDSLADDNLEPRRESLPVGPWLTATTQAFGPRVGRPVTLNLPEEIGNLRLHADNKLVTRALFNLLDNAAKYSPPDSAIGIRAFRVQGELGIQVSDAGIGMEAADLERIFLKSVRLAPEGGVAGLGLGLHLAQRIAAVHGGRIAVASLPGHGSTFTLWLPLHP
jgi:signal transduction histidine kinase